MAFAVTGQSTREGIHEFTISGQKVKYDANMDLLYTWIGGLMPHWGSGVIPEPFIRNQIINATNGNAGYGSTFTGMPQSMPKPADLSDQTRVELAPTVTATLGRVPPMFNNMRVSGIGTIPVQSRVDFNATQPRPKKRFLEDLPTSADELQGFISDWYHSYGRKNNTGTFRRRGRRRY